MTVYIHMYMYTYPYFTRKNICAICDHRESISSKSPPLRRAPHSSRSAAALRRADRSVASADPSWRPRGRRLCRRPPAGRWPGPLRRFRSSWLFLRDFFWVGPGGTMWHLYIYIPIFIYIYILGADDTGLCGQFSRGFLAHDMGFMYRFCYVFFFKHDMGIMRRPNGQVFFHFIDRWHGNKWSNLHMTWDFQGDTDVQDGKWQVSSFKFL